MARTTVPRLRQGSLLESAKSALSFSWAMSLFGVQQVANLFSPKAFEELSHAVEAELGDVLKAAFRAGDRWQKGVVDLALGADARGPARRPASGSPPPPQPAAEPAISAEFPYAPHYVEVLG